MLLACNSQHVAVNKSTNGVREWQPQNLEKASIQGMGQCCHPLPRKTWRFPVYVGAFLIRAVLSLQFREQQELRTARGLANSSVPKITCNMIPLVLTVNPGMNIYIIPGVPTFL